MLEFDKCVGCGELKIGFSVVGISIVLPNGDFVYESLFVRDETIEALGRKEEELGLGHIEQNAVLWCVMLLEPFGEPPCFGGGKSFKSET